MTEQTIDFELWNEFEEELNKTKNIKIEFPENSTAIYSEGIKQFFNIFLTESLPEGQINITLEKNFAVYIVQNELDIGQIKTKYQSQKWSVGGLLGWIKKVSNGEITQLNIGEIVNWCKENNRLDLIELFADLKGLKEEDILRKENLKYISTHLNLFDDIKIITQIFGKEYTHLHKLLPYHLTACVVPEKYLIVKLGQMEIDLRDYLFLVYPTSSAKGNIKNLLLKINRDLGREAISLTSYHEEQLVGKVIKRRKKVEIGITSKGNPKYEFQDEFIINPGHFISDYLIFDESKSLLMEKDKEISRNFLLIAMDKYKDNEIYKRLADNLNNPEEVIRYYPKFCALLGTQPFKFPQDKIVLNGFQKRVTLDYLPPIIRPDSIFDEKLDNKQSCIENYNKILFHLETISNIFKNKGEFSSYQVWTFEQGFENKFKECFKLLRSAGLYNTRKKRNYTKLIEWQLQDRLLKKSCLLALWKDKTLKVTSQHCELAFMDLLEDFIIELDFVNEKVYGDLDYGSVWGTSNLKEQEVLSFLLKRNATSEENTNVSIEEFKSKIQDNFKVREDQARKIYYKMIESSLIYSKTTISAEAGTKVWLANIPQENKEQFFNNQVKEKYNQLCDKYSKGGSGGSGGNGLEVEK